MKERIVGGMRCAEVLEHLSDYVDDELDAVVAQKIQIHLLGCANCERFGSNFGSMVVALRREAKASERARSDVLARLLAELRKAIPAS